MLMMRQMRYPDVPDKLPESIGNLVGLQVLRMMGNTTIPCKLLAKQCRSS
jgi:hypothetical protein